MNAQLDDLVRRMRTQLCPSPQEEAHLSTQVEELLQQARAVAEVFRNEGTPTFEPIIVGSTAKGTWLAGDVDIDLFLMFPPDLDRATLEALGLRAGKELLPTWTLRYAEHPYVHGRLGGYDADVVPAYAVEDAARIQSAVDRTPFHNAYVLAALEEAPERRDEIRLMKGWLKGIGVYGAETALAGISGYLCEVLTLHHGGFIPAVQAFVSYRPGTRIDTVGDSGATFPNDDLVVIDPVDPGRNAASAVSRDKLERLRSAAAAFLEAPSQRFFHPVPLPPLGPAHAARLVAPGAAAVITFPVPTMREDAIIPHLNRAAESLASVLERQGFEPVRTAGGTSVDASRAFLFVQTRAASLPAERVHVGPPVSPGPRADQFRAKYADHPDVVAPVHEIEQDGRVHHAVRLCNRRRELGERIEDVLSSRLSLGKHADRALRAGAEILSLEAAVRAPDLERILAEILAPVPPWARSGDPEQDYAPSPA